MTAGTVFKIKKYALHDGPGIRTTIFLKGCPLGCRWCHNPEGIDPRPQAMSRRTSSGDIDETVGWVVDAADLIREIEKDILFYDESGGGVTFSGGEPLIQPQFLEALLDACNRREIHATLDTSGFAPAAVIDRILPRLQLILFDLKIVDEARHRRFTGVSNRIILDNLARIDARRTPLRIRFPIISGMTDDPANVAAVLRLSRRLKAVAGVDLLPFHRIGADKYRRLGLTDNLTEIDCPSVERLTEIQARFESAGLPATIGG